MVFSMSPLKEIKLRLGTGGAEVAQKGSFEGVHFTGAKTAVERQKSILLCVLQDIIISAVV